MTAAPFNTNSREAWLLHLAERLNETLFKGDMPAYRVTCGWPSRGATAQNGRTIGQCFDPKASDDETSELIVSMCLDDRMEVAATLAHEMVHAVVGIDAGHKAPFKKLATAIGLVGPMTATVAGDAFKQTVQPILDAMGPYPHAKLNASSRGRKQSTRLIKVECEACGYTARVTRKWIDLAGAPHCPIHGEMEIA